MTPRRPSADARAAQQPDAARERRSRATAKDTSAGEASAPRARKAAAPSSDGDDARYFVMDGRRWRRTDPGIPEALRRELVSALMAARRAVYEAQRAGSKQAEAAARARVHDAKLALGERGRPYWDAAEPAAQRLRIEASLRALLSARGRDKTICPSDVARALGGASWRSLLPLVRETALELEARGELEVRQRGQRVDPRKARGPIRYAQR